MKNVVIALFALGLMSACGGDDSQPAVGGGTGGSAGSGAGGMGGSGGTGGGTPPAAEDCNGQDDDQDGFVDEGIQARSCSSACGMGNEVCIQGAWSMCDAPAVIDEFCDGVDNDCDGTADEGLSRQCSTDCGTGEESCTDGDWTGCNAPAPGVEDCDGEDNDCDGNVDENVYRECRTECGVGSEACLGNNMWGECDSVIIAEEACDDDMDNDCDGQADEGCDCSEGDTQPCSSDVGACSRGTQVCDADGNWGACVDAEGEPVKTPGETAEDCNGIDDDCNGLVDDVMVDAECGQDGPGECRMGRLSCEGGVRACVGGVEPSAETCDMLDNDCDGNVDENAEAVAETCDSRDNDCDGTVDEDVAPDQWEPNDSCGDGARLGTMDQPDGDDAPPTLDRQGMLSGGNVDWFHVRVDEDSGVCGAGFGNQDYQLRASLTDLPDGVVYELCGKAHVSNNLPLFNTGDDDGFGDSCRIDNETCVRSDSGMDMTVSLSAEDRCGRGNDLFGAFQIRAVDGAPACAPYTLRFTVVND